MKIFVCCSKHFYGKIDPIKKKLEEAGHVITLPNSYNQPLKEEELKKNSPEEHIKWKADMIRLQLDKVANNDAVLILNCEKNGQPNYIGGATFIEMFKAFELNKKIFLLNPIPDGIFRDELVAMNPTILNGDVSKILS